MESPEEGIPSGILYVVVAVAISLFVMPWIAAPGVALVGFGILFLSSIRFGRADISARLLIGGTFLVTGTVVVAAALWLWQPIGPG